MRSVIFKADRRPVHGNLKVVSERILYTKQEELVIFR